MPVPREFFENGNRDELVVLIHGFRASKGMADVKVAIAEAMPNADIYMPRLPFARYWGISMVKAETVVANLLDRIDQLVSEREAVGSTGKGRDGGSGYRRITVVGHSFGAVIARRVVIAAFGEQRDGSGRRMAPFEPELARFASPRPWAGRIGRLVLLAGMNRGWAVSSAMDWLTSATWSFGQILSETVFLGKPTVLAIRRGAPFLVQTRLQWMALMDPHFGPRPLLCTVQLLGTIDDVVSPDDNVDYSVDLAASGPGQSYFYIEVRHSGHVSIVDMAKDGSSETREARELRRERFIEALTALPGTLATKSIPREAMADTLPPEPDEDVTDLVFVIHGIRDKGYWTQKIARTIKEEARNFPVAEDGRKRKVESWTESYGYFAMLPFVSPIVRQRKVEWLMDRYAEARARYPRAAFHYVGHSNGTYLAAQALRDYPAARFDNIVFAGSVVRCDYDWRSLTNPNPAEGDPRVKRVLNYVATADWVVAAAPKAVQWLRGFRLGSAGHDGFHEQYPNVPVYQVEYVTGQHDAGLRSANWTDIAKFILSGSPPPANRSHYVRKPNRFVRLLGKISFTLPFLIVGLLVGIGYRIIHPIFSGDLSAPAAAAATLSFVLFILAIRLVVTRV